jgi:WD40 repeat protein
VATCNDNKLRVWDLKSDLHKLDAGKTTRQANACLSCATYSCFAGKSPVRSSDPTLIISHDNHTGRWISTFRTIFDPANDDTIIIGNMKRFMDIYSATREDGLPLSQLSNELLTAIPTLNAVHPSTEFDVIVSGTASGRMHLWS